MKSKFNVAIISLSCAVLLGACGQGTTESETARTCLSVIPAPISVAAGEYNIGNDNAYPEEAPGRTAQVSAFNIDAAEVTNAQFAAFVKATGYVTDAEKPQPGFGTPGGAVFRVPSVSSRSWWQFTEGANWRHPEGPDSDITGKETEPVVQVSLRDARAYADWAQRRLPSEAEWEVAAKGGAESIYVWGEDLTPDGEEQANTWQGAFPVKNLTRDGYFLRAPAGCYAPNGYGLYDMIGNVWEWTETPFQGGAAPGAHVIKGGSFLCAENYCRRYRASARQPQEVDFSTNHIGFRTVAAE